MSPPSLILENDGQGNFKDVTSELAPALQNLGMVTDALWTDYDDDKDQDLVIVGEWMPITFLENTNNTFRPSPFALRQSFGWWNTIAAADMDKDGDMDYVVGNFGQNGQNKS